MRAYYKIDLMKIGHPVKKLVHPKIYDSKGRKEFKEPQADHVAVVTEIRRSLIKQYGEENVKGRIEGDYSIVYVE